MATIHVPGPGRPNVLIEAATGEGILDLDADTVIGLYKAHGALLFRGFGADAGQFRRFAWTFCSTAVFNESPGRRPIEPEHNIHTVDGGVGEFSLHPELSREPWKPDIAFFACLSAPRRGGETTICDGVEMVRALPKPRGTAAALHQTDMAGAVSILARHAVSDRCRSDAADAAGLPLLVSPGAR
jgi:alpha-ketoglutarate-dependent taurine dioxygenase